MHYWDFDDIDDSVGGLTGTDVTGSNYTLSSATYGAAYTGAGNAMQTELSGTGFTVATGGALDFNSDWSVSYWVYNDRAGDSDSRGVRVYDTLSGTTTGIQLGSNGSGLHNARFDGGLGSVVTNGQTSMPMVVEDAWSHVVMNYEFGGTVTVYFDGVLVDTDDVSGITDPLTATQDLEIGMINGGGSLGASQQGALDDLAFYDGLLDANQIAGLAAGTITPADVPEPTSLALLGLGGLLVARRRRLA